MKRKIVLIFVAICILCCACGEKNGSKEISKNQSQAESTNQPEEEEKQPEFVCHSFLGQSFLTEEYALYHNQDSRLQIFDSESKIGMPFCFDAGCIHEQTKRSIDGKVIQEGCVAYEFSNQPVMIQGEKCYFLSDNGELYCSDLQGENRKLIGTLPSYASYPDSVFFTNEAMFAVYQNPYDLIETKNSDGETQWLVGEMKDVNIAGIMRIDLEDGQFSEAFRTQNYNARVAQCDVRGNHIYFLSFFLDIPYVGPDLDTYGDSGQIPDGLTKENYWEEMPKHQWAEIYDYNIATKEVTCILDKRQYSDVYFCEDFFLLDGEDNKTGMYRYNGEYIRELDFEIWKVVRTDSGLVCSQSSEPNVYRLYDAETGEEIKKTEISSTVFQPEVFIGKSCYGFVIGENGMEAGYLSTEDFWNGEGQNAISLQGYETAK